MKAENEKAIKTSSPEILKDKKVEKKDTKSATKQKKTTTSKNSPIKKTKKVSKK